LTLSLPKRSPFQELNRSVKLLRIDTEAMTHPTVPSHLIDLSLHSSHTERMQVEKTEALRDLRYPVLVATDPKPDALYREALKEIEESCGGAASALSRVVISADQSA